MKQMRFSVRGRRYDAGTMPVRCCMPVRWSMAQGLQNLREKHKKCEKDKYDRALFFLARSEVLFAAVCSCNLRGRVRQPCILHCISLNICERHEMLCNGGLALHASGSHDILKLARTKMACRLQQLAHPRNEETWQQPKKS